MNTQVIKQYNENILELITHIEMFKRFDDISGAESELEAYKNSIQNEIPRKEKDILTFSTIIDVMSVKGMDINFIQKKLEEKRIELSNAKETLKAIEEVLE